MAITCPRCGAGFDATLFQFGHRIRCRCGAEVCYPGADLRSGHALEHARPETATASPSAGPRNAVPGNPEGDGNVGQNASSR